MNQLYAGGALDIWGESTPNAFTDGLTIFEDILLGGKAQASNIEGFFPGATNQQIQNALTALGELYPTTAPTALALAAPALAAAVADPAVAIDPPMSANSAAPQKPEDSAAPTAVALTVAAPTIATPSIPVPTGGEAISVADGGGTAQQSSLSVTHSSLSLGVPADLTGTGKGTGSTALNESLSKLNIDPLSQVETPTWGSNSGDTLSVPDQDKADNLTGTATVAASVTVPASQPTVTVETSAPTAVPGELVPLVNDVSAPFRRKRSIEQAIRTKPQPE